MLDNNVSVTLNLSGFDVNLILLALETERRKRLEKTPWENRNPKGYPPRFSYDHTAKPVRQCDSTIKYIMNQITQIEKGE